jgi:Zn-dependent protease with chaperone function
MKEHLAPAVPRTAGLSLLLAAALILIAVPALCGPFDISVNTEIQAGKEAASWIEHNMPISTDPVTNAKLESIGRRLTQAAQRKDLRYEFHVIAISEVNAISLPGGFIYCYQGLIQALPSDDALAFVMAHEMVHAAKRHWAARMKKATTLSVLTLGRADFLNLFLVPHYSREAEREADKLGMEIAARSGFDPQGAVDAMATLKKLAGSRKEGLPIFASHPATDTRMAYLKEMADKLTAEAQKPRDVPSTTPPAGVPVYDLGGIEPAANDYYPLAEGSRWVYRYQDERGGLLRQKVTIVERLPDAAGVFRVESRLGEDVSVSVKSLVATTKSAIFRQTEPSSSDRATEKKSGWEMVYPLSSTEAAPDGFRVGGVERVEAPYGAFDAIKVEKLGASGEVTRTAWLAPGVGLVKETWPDGLTKVLEEYKPARMAGSATQN